MVLTTTPAICSYGAEVTLRSLSAFRKEIPGVLRSRNIEYVHRLRVASRRLATALVVFQSCHPSKRVKAWQKDLDRTTSVLGKARDLDIQADGVEKYLKEVSSVDQRAGIRRLLLRIRQKRKRIRTELDKMLAMLEKKATLVSLDAHLRALISSHPALPSRNGNITRLFASGTILPVLENFLSYEPFIDNVEAVEELHAMRIAAKKLRYTLECFSAVYPDELAEYLSVIRAVQDQLGRIHDCDVWQTESSRFIERERHRTEKYYGSDLPMKRLMPGFTAFFENQHRQRIQAYQSFLNYWHDLIRVRLWEKLRSRLAPENQMKQPTHH